MDTNLSRYDHFEDSMTRSISLKGTVRILLDRQGGSVAESVKTRRIYPSAQRDTGSNPKTSPLV